MLTAIKNNLEATSSFDFTNQIWQYFLCKRIQSKKKRGKNIGRGREILRIEGFVSQRTLIVHLRSKFDRLDAAAVDCDRTRVPWGLGFVLGLITEFTLLDRSKVVLRLEVHTRPHPHTCAQRNTGYRSCCLHLAATPPWYQRSSML